MHKTRTLLEAIQHWAETTPDKIAIIEGLSGKQISYSDFWMQIRAFATKLQTRGLTQGACVSLRVSQSIDYMAAFYGVQLAGGIAVPLEKSMSDELLNRTAEYFDSEFVSDAEPYDATLPFVQYGGAIIGTNAEFLLPQDDMAIATILYTTGTTGKNKGVLSSFRCRFSGAENVVYTYEITQSDVALVPQVLSHSGALRRVEAMFVAGGTVVIMDAVMFFGNVFSALSKYGVTIFQLVPAQVALILRSAEKMLVKANDQLRILSVGSAVIPEAHKERLRTLLPDVRLFNDFGSTEAIGSAYFEWNKYPPKPDCVGIESLHSKIVFLDEGGSVLETTSYSQPGILATEGDTLMSGYWHEPELTATVLKEGRVVSSDLGFRGTDGFIYIVGRKTDIIVSGANKIAPSEIEELVSDIQGIKECAAVAKPDTVMGEVPALFVVVNEGYAFDALEIEYYLKDKLERFKVPKTENIILINELPRTEGTGKVLRKELVKRFDS